MRKTAGTGWWVVAAVSALAVGPAAGSAWAAPAVHGFADVRAGVRTQEDRTQDDVSLAEARLQLRAEPDWGWAVAAVRVDFLVDAVPRSFALDLERGQGAVDLREANVWFSPVSFLDVKAGRQILTWGVGDLLFVNDLFPKDWQAFFIGRDTDYLKAPSDAALFSFYGPGGWNLDVAYTPRFDADRHISGERLSYWNPMRGARAGRAAVTDPVARDDWFGDDETAARLRGMLGGVEAALYFYDGYWKSPEGWDAPAGRPYYPKLAVYGASLRGPAGRGVVSLETGYYDSREDRRGEDPFVPNRQQRVLAGYERELMRDLQLGLQYYAEIMLDHGAYRAALPAGMSARDEVRQVLTARLTRMAMSQNLTLSLFVYWSPTDEDGYARPYAAYKASDAWLLAAGANVFFGREDHTFFGQFKDNNNVYAAVRYSF